MKLRLRNFQGDVRLVELTTGDIEAWKEAARTQFRRTETDVTLLHLGQIVSDGKPLDDAGIKDNDVLVVAFGPLKRIEKRESGEINAEDAGGADRTAGSSLEKPEVKAMLEHPDFRKAKERFQSDPSKWDTIYSHLIRIFPGAAHFLINEKETLKKMMSQTEFGGAGEAGEQEEVALQAEDLTFSAQEQEDINNIMSMTNDREVAIRLYLEAEKNLEGALTLMAERQG